jgi:hypothetical protein
MDYYDQLWVRIKHLIQSKPIGAPPDWHVVYTVLSPRRNLIRVFENHLVRQSDGDSSDEREIPKSHVIIMAERAISSPTKQYSIDDPNIKPGFVGSIICSLLHHLDAEFSYETGRKLFYHPGRGVEWV